jgi:hypothetical protein
LLTAGYREIPSVLTCACPAERNETVMVLWKLVRIKNGRASAPMRDPWRTPVSFFRKKPANDLVPIHPDNSNSKDWAILLEAGTIVGPSQQRIRVARWMQDKKIVKKHDMFLRTKYFIVIEGYNPRIHALYFCPQLFRHVADELVPLDGEEIGQLIARAVEASAVERRPWYDPTDELPREPLINRDMLGEFDTLVVELPQQRESLPAANQPLLGRPASEQTEAQAQTAAPDTEAPVAETGVAESGLEKPAPTLDGSDSGIGKRRRAKIPNSMDVGSDL